MTTQVQMRGAATATQQARTLAAREWDIDTTLYRPYIHDGSTPGGIGLARLRDIQNNTAIYASASGTNALTATIAPAPASLATGQAFRVLIANNNTGAVTINFNSLGAESVKKYAAGVKADLDADDLVAGMIVEMVYDGTDFVVFPGGGRESDVIASTVQTGSFSTVTISDIFTPENIYDIDMLAAGSGASASEIQFRLSIGGGSLSSYYKCCANASATAHSTRLTLHQVADASNTNFFWIGVHGSTAEQGGDVIGNTNQYDSIQFRFSTGNIGDHKITVREYPVEV